MDSDSEGSTERGTEIIIYSYYESSHKFHYTYSVYFFGGASQSLWKGASCVRKIKNVILVNQLAKSELTLIANLS